MNSKVLINELILISGILSINNLFMTSYFREALFKIILSVGSNEINLFG